MKAFKYELHLHTSQGSACGGSTGAQMVDYYKSKGYSGFIVTDHYIGGNTSVNLGFGWVSGISRLDELMIPWEEAVDTFCAGFEDAKRRGDEVGFDVFFGFEYCFQGTEFLILGLDKDWLKQNPQVCELDLKPALRRFKEGGAFIIHAHPFRQAPYILQLRLEPDFIDAVEVFNGGNLNEWNRKAEKYALMHGLLETSGADAHRVGDRTAGIITEKRVKTIQEFIGIIKNREYTLIKSE